MTSQTATRCSVCRRAFRPYANDMGRCRPCARTRMETVHAACADETARVQRRIDAGAHIVIETAFGPYRIHSVTRDFDYHCYAIGADGSESRHTRWFAGCNDGQWATIMGQAGEARNRAFAS